MSEQDEIKTQIRVWPKTRLKLEEIARRRRWKINATIDALCDLFLSNDLEPTDRTSGRRKPVKAAA